MDWGEGEVHEYATKVLCQYPAILTEQVWEEKDLSYGIRDTSSLQDTAGNQKRAI